MPHCMRGHELKVGDRVLVPAIVVSVSPGEDYCNVTVQTAHTMPPYPDSPTSVTLNTKQVAAAGLVGFEGELDMFPLGCGGPPLESPPDDHQPAA